MQSEVAPECDICYVLLYQVLFYTFTGKLLQEQERV